MWPPGVGVQGKGEGEGSPSVPSQAALALLWSLSQSALPSTVLEAFPPGRPRASAVSSQIPTLGRN